MALTCDSDLSLLLDADLETVDDPGHGGRIGPRDVVWASTNIFRTADWRGFYLMPLQYSPGWKTTTTAATPYARARLSAYSQTAGTWTEREWHSSGDWWICLQGTAGTLTTTGTGWSGGSGGNLRKNAGIHLDAYLFGAMASPDEVLRVTFGNGKFQLSLSGTGYATLTRLDFDPDTVVAEGQLVPEDASHEMLSLSIWPTMRRCLYLLGTGGKQVVYEDTAIHPELEDVVDPSAPNPLCPSGPVVVQVFRRGAVQLTELAFASTGSMEAVVNLPYAPTGTLNLIDKETQSLSNKDVPTGTSLLVTTPDYDPGTPSDTLKVRAAFTASTDQRTTPVLYTAGFGFAPTTVARVPDDSNVISSVLRDGFRLDADEERTTLTVPLKNAETLRQANNRIAILKTSDGDEILRGYAIDPETPSMNALDACILTVVDEWDRLDGTLLPNTHQFDGMYWVDAVRYVLEFCGIPAARQDIETSLFRLPPKSVNGPEGDSSALIQPGTGQTAGEFLRYLRDTYSSRRMHFASVGGVVKFVCKEESTLAATPLVNLYTTTAAAVLAGKDRRYTVRDWQSRVTRPEANEVWAIGQDPSGAWLYAPYIDYASQNPATPEASRNSRWLGERRVVILIDPSLSTQAEVNAACTFLAARTVYAVESATFTAEWHPQVQRFNSVTVDGYTYKVREYGVDIMREQGTSFGAWRPCQYRVERVLYDA